MEIVTIMLLGAILNGLLASSRGRGAIAWALLGAFFPLISLLALVLMKDLKTTNSAEEKLAESEHKRRLAEIRAETAVSSDTKICPQCAETIKSAAKVCRFCGNKFSDTSVFQVPTTITEGEYRGTPYKEMPDGAIHANINGEDRTWENLVNFKWDLDEGGADRSISQNNSSRVHKSNRHR